MHGLRASASCHLCLWPVAVAKLSRWVLCDSPGPGGLAEQGEVSLEMTSLSGAQILGLFSEHWPCCLCTASQRQGQIPLLPSALFPFDILLGSAGKVLSAPPQTVENSKLQPS